MRDIVLIKTSQGRLPFRSVEHRAGDTVSPNGYLDFELLSREEADAREVEGGRRGESNLIDLATCVYPGGKGWTCDVDAVLAFARANGPLFGQNVDGSTSESLRAWSYAAYAAAVAVRLQECVNGRSSLATLAALGLPRKMLLTETSSGKALTTFEVVLRASGAYAELFRRLGFIARLIVRDGVYHYVFVNASLETGVAYPRIIMCFDVVRTSTELSYTDVRNLCDLLEGMGDCAPEISRQLGIREDASAPAEDKTHGEGVAHKPLYAMSEPALCEEDLPAITSLVKAMILAHIRSSSIDVFRGDSKTGYLSFDSFLSWLWYDFSCHLGVISIGYCRECGKPFSLVGHRGVEKQYCSVKCKTDSKNARDRAKHAEARRLFMGGFSVERIAIEVYSGTRGDLKTVRKLLSTWTELKQRLGNSVDDFGYEGSDLLARCIAEGLTVRPMLPSRLRKGFDEYLASK